MTAFNATTDEKNSNSIQKLKKKRKALGKDGFSQMVGTAWRQKIYEQKSFLSILKRRAILTYLPSHTKLEMKCVLGVL